MKKLKRIARLVSVGVFVFFFHAKSKASELSPVDKRIETIRKKIKEDLKDKDAKESVVDFKKYTNTGDWVNWGNWGNWNNWNNWAKWNDWANWNNWGNWRNY
ncbi:MAG: hypothetical protein QM763_10595 [Agriterribacter sp.]